jgi:hypothetical protein
VEWPRLLVSGVATAAAGLLLFVTVHSLAIAPIWSRLGRGLPFAMLAGIGFAYAFEHVARLGGRAASRGARFGIVMFASLVPATLYSNALRLAGVRANDWPGIAGSLLLAAASGAAAGWLSGRTIPASRAFALAALALLVASAGPVPVVTGPPAAWLYFGFVPICVGGGIVLALTRDMIVREEG